VTVNASDRSAFQLQFHYSKRSLISTALLPSGLLDPGLRVILMATVNGIPNVLMDGIVTRQDVAPSGQPGLSALTLTGGLPFFGGPGNNYSMHAIVEAVARVRANRSSLAMVAANGGYLSKHSVGIYGSVEDGTWQPTADAALRARFAALPTVALAPETTNRASVESWVLTLRKGAPEMAYVAARVGEERLLAKPCEGDTGTLAAMREREPIGRAIAVSHDGKVHRFRFAD
jgi:acetyl-CoA C-acetyltransferase